MLSSPLMAMVCTVVAHQGPTRHVCDVPHAAVVAGADGHAEDARDGRKQRVASRFRIVMHPPTKVRDVHHTKWEQFVDAELEREQCDVAPGRSAHAMLTQLHKCVCVRAAGCMPGLERGVRVRGAGRAHFIRPALFPDPAKLPTEP